MRGGSISAAGFALAVSATVWHFGAPHWTLNQMRAAAEARDTAALASHVDFPALRDSLEAGSRGAAIAGGTADGSPERPDPALGTALLDPMIEALASPAGVRAMLLGDTDRRLAGPAAPPIDFGEGGFEIDREGFSKGRTDGAAGALVFRRRGYVWKLAGVDLPKKTLAALR